MEIKPTSYPAAYEMSKKIVSQLQAHYLSKHKQKATYWLLDFIESFEGVTYFLQVKHFTLKQNKGIVRSKSLTKQELNKSKSPRAKSPKAKHRQSVFKESDPST